MPMPLPIPHCPISIWCTPIESSDSGALSPAGWPHHAMHCWSCCHSRSSCRSWPDQEDLLWQQDQQHCLFVVGLVMKAWSSPTRNFRENLYQHACTLNQLVLLWGVQLLNSRLSAEKSWTGKSKKSNELWEQLLPFFPADPLANAIPELCYREQIALCSWQSGAFAVFLCRRPLLRWLRRLTGNTTSNLWPSSDQQRKFKQFDSI